MALRNIMLSMIMGSLWATSSATAIYDSVHAECDTINSKETEFAVSMPDSAGIAPAQKPGFFKRIINYFNESNKPKAYKDFDFSIIGGPHYSSDTKLGIGLVAAGFYRSDKTDSITPPSNVSLYGDVSTVGFYMVGIRGNHIFKFDKNRIDYNLYFYTFPRRFWGIGYEQGNNMDNKSKFDETFVQASFNWLHEITPHLFIGPGAGFTYAHASDIEHPELWDGQPFHSATYSLGFKIQYDTRDNLTATQYGFLASAEQRFNPAFLGNRQAFSSTELRLCYFRNLWKGSVLAMQYHAKVNYGDVPWAMMATFGGSNSMRGYYDGRFRDKGEMDFTVELRQHVWRRNGIVVWGGVGTVFPRFSAIQMRRLLPNGGIGYRWEFKQRTNVRLDFGFGKGENSFIFSINEAF